MRQCAVRAPLESLSECGAMFSTATAMMRNLMSVFQTKENKMDNCRDNKSIGFYSSEGIDILMRWNIELLKSKIHTFSGEVVPGRSFGVLSMKFLVLSQPSDCIIKPF